jgi:peptidoglycan hydrolase FlgJ
MNIGSGDILSIGRYQELKSSLQKSRAELKTSGPAGGNTDKTEDAKLREACTEFQALFIKQMLDSMRSTIDKQGLLNGGQAEEIFEDMLYDEYAKKISKTASLGLDDMIYRELSQQKPIL